MDNTNNADTNNIITMLTNLSKLLLLQKEALGLIHFAKKCESTIVLFLKTIILTINFSC